jgi:hypothetical protein
VLEGLETEARAARIGLWAVIRSRCRRGSGDGDAVSGGGGKVAGPEARAIPTSPLGQRRWPRGGALVGAAGRRKGGGVDGEGESVVQSIVYGLVKAVRLASSGGSVRSNVSAPS